MIASLFPLAGTLTSLIDTTPAERNQKEWKPAAILASIVLPVHLLGMMEVKPNIKNSFTTYIASACLITGTQWCAGRQFGHILGRFIDTLN